MFWPTNQPLTHQKTPTNGWGSLYRFQIFKWNQNISILSSHIAFLLIWGYPLEGGRWEWGWVGAPHPCCMHTCMHVHAHTHTHTCMHVKHDKHGCLHGGGHLQFPNMFILVFRACMHLHVHLSRDTPHAPSCPQPIYLLPRAAGSPNHQRFISPELIEIIRFCLKNLFLWTFLNSSRLTLITLDTPHLPVPPPWSWRSWNF